MSAKKEQSLICLTNPRLNQTTVHGLKLTRTQSRMPCTCLLHSQCNTFVADTHFFPRKVPVAWLRRFNTLDMRYMQVVCFKSPLYNYKCMSLVFVFNYFLTHRKEIKTSDLAHVRFPAIDFNCMPKVVPLILVKLLALALHRESPV